jgi:hypothetical protein
MTSSLRRIHMSFQFLKNAVAAAGHTISEGEHILATDLQAIRNYLHFNGIHIGEEFQRFEEYIKEHFGGQAPGTATPVVAPPAPEPVVEAPQAPAPEPVVETPQVELIPPAPEPVPGEPVVETTPETTDIGSI